MKSVECNKNELKKCSLIRSSVMQFSVYPSKSKQPMWFSVIYLGLVNRHYINFYFREFRIPIFSLIFPLIKTIDAIWKIHQGKLPLVKARIGCPILRRFHWLLNFFSSSVTDSPSYCCSCAAVWWWGSREVVVRCIDDRRGIFGVTDDRCAIWAWIGSWKV